MVVKTDSSKPGGGPSPPGKNKESEVNFESRTAAKKSGSLQASILETPQFCCFEVIGSVVYPFACQSGSMLSIVLSIVPVLLVPLAPASFLVPAHPVPFRCCGSFGSLESLF